MFAALVLAWQQQEVTPPPGPDVLAEAREPQSKDFEESALEAPSLRDPWVLSSRDGSITAELQGKIDLDVGFFDADPSLESVTGDWNNAGKLRRARLGVQGQVGEWTRYRLTTDLAAGEMRDVYVELDRWFGPGALRFGHFREPIGLWNRTPVHHGVFLERPLANALFPSRNIGVSYALPFDEGRGSWTSGVFRDSDAEGVSEDGDGSNEFALTSRLTWLARDRNQGNDRVHLGASFSWRNPDDERVNFGGGAIAKLGPDLLTTGDVIADQVYLFGVESAWVLGPNTFQAEYAYAGFDQPSGVSPGMKGWSLEASRMLTGEVRDYRYGRGVVWGVKPANPYQPHGEGWGAFEVGFRASSLDLQDEGVTGGKGMNLAVAWNWYLSSHYRLQTNFVRADRDDAGDVHAVLVRLHFRF